MSIVYAGAEVSTLKSTRPPGVVLMSVVKPTIELSREGTSQPGVPGLVFSHRTALVTGASHGAALAVGADVRTNGKTTPAATAKDNIVRDKRVSTVPTLGLMTCSTKRGDAWLRPDARHYPN